VFLRGALVRSNDYMTYCFRFTSLLVFLSISLKSAATYNIPQNPVPVDDTVTIARCGGCHQRSETEVMRRISDMFRVLS
jgi:hypothetical protein